MQIFPDEPKPPGKPSSDDENDRAPSIPDASTPKRMGRPSIRTGEIIERILDGLSQGTPLTLICEGEGMPCDNTVRNWADADQELYEAIARARETGFDRIAMDAIAIADNVDEHAQSDTITLSSGLQIPDKEWIMRSKLRVDTRLKLLSKWDPKRYGDRVSQEISGPDGGPIRSSHELSDELKGAILEKTAEAAAIAATVQPPSSFRGSDDEA